ncbi:MAG: DMT family transporter [Candidatus Pseudothioglobus sp.]
MNNHLKGLLIAFFGIVILTPDAVLVRLADSNSWTVLFWRGIFFATGIIVILLLTYRSKAVNELINIGKGGVLIGILTALGGTSFILAIHYTSIDKTLLIISTSPIMVAIISLLMLKEKPEFYTWISMIIVFIGIYIVMAGDSGGMNLMGNFFALVSVIIGGFSFTLLRKYKNVNMVPAMAVNGIVIAFIGFIFADSLVLSSQSMLYIFASGIVLAVSFSLITIAPQYIPAHEVAMFFPLGTVLGTLLAWIVIKEEPSSNALIGGAIVIITLFSHAWYSAKSYQKVNNKHIAK